LKEILEYVSGMILNFCVPVWYSFFLVEFAETLNFVKCYMKTQTCNTSFLSSCICLANYIFSWSCSFFHYWV